jgi:hypothetical protein
MQSISGHLIDCRTSLMGSAKLIPVKTFNPDGVVPFQKNINSNTFNPYGIVEKKTKSLLLLEKCITTSRSDRALFKLLNYFFHKRFNFDWLLSIFLHNHLNLKITELSYCFTKTAGTNSFPVSQEITCQLILSAIYNLNLKVNYMIYEGVLRRYNYVRLNKLFI